MKTNYDKIIGLYSPDTWMKTPSEGKDIVNANKTFQFYFSDNDLKVVKDKDGNTPQMTSDDTFLLGFLGGI